MPKKDFTQVAHAVFQEATGETPKTAKTARQEGAAKGGLKGGAARAAKLTPQQRAKIARIAAQARWKKA